MLNTDDDENGEEIAAGATSNANDIDGVLEYSYFNPSTATPVDADVEVELLLVALAGAASISSRLNNPKPLCRPIMLSESSRFIDNDEGGKSNPNPVLLLLIVVEDQSRGVGLDGVISLSRRDEEYAYGKEVPLVVEEVLEIEDWANFILVTMSSISLEVEEREED